MKTRRLYTSLFTPEMAERIHQMSVEESNRRFMKDEVFETPEIAAEVLHDLIECYEGTDGPLVYPLFLRDGDVLIGHIEAVPLEDGDWEVGYHIGEDYQGNGYAQEAVQAFTPVMRKKLNIKEMFGISRADNPASCRVLEKCGYKLMDESVRPYQGTPQPVRRYCFTLPEKIVIRREEGKDWFQSEWMVKQAFYNLHVPGCNEHLYLHKLRSDPVYIPELAYVAEIDGEVAGGIWYIKSAIDTGHSVEEVITFGPLAVRPDCQSLGIGKMLLDKTIPLARELGYKGIIILGEPDYYPRHGFVTCDRFGITTGDGKNFPAFMGMELIPGGLSGISGKFIEPAVCNELPDEQLEAYDRLFPALRKKKQAGQWA